MSDASEALIAKILAQRERWVDLEPGKRVKVRRPDLVQALVMRSQRGVQLHEAYAGAVVAWEGITEADAVEGGAATTALDFTPALWRLLWGDRPDWLIKTTEAVKALLDEADTRREAAAKN